MRLTYWSPLHYYRPSVWNQRIIRIKGIDHNEHVISEIKNTTQNYNEHVFLLFSSKLSDFTETRLPACVIPVLHVSSNREYQRNIDEFLAIDCEYKVLSIFCYEQIIVRHDFDWLFVSGLSHSKINNMIYYAKNRHIPVYVERFNHTREIPTELNTRQIPNRLEKAMRTPCLQLQNL